jgi:hypothetical protein
MKALISCIILNGVMFCVVFFLLTTAETAQRTYLFSALKEIEQSGITANESGYKINNDVKERILAVNPVRSLHIPVIIVVGFWAILMSFLFWRLRMPARPLNT